MNDDQFTKLFTSIEDMKSQLANMATKDDIAVLRDEVHVGFDQIASRLDDDDTERGAMTAQLDRHEGWIHQLADKSGTELAVDA